jgi:putative ABC transport system permease protein
MKQERGRLAALFERILRVYPEDFRRLFAEDMADQFARRCAESYRSGGRLFLYAFAVRTTLEVLVEGALEHSRSLRNRRPRGRGRRKPRSFEMSIEMTTEIRHALRSLGKTPAFTLLAILTLGLGIAVTTTMFSLTSTLLFAELPVSDPEGMVFVWARNERASENRTPLSLPEVAELRAEVTSFASVGTAVEESLQLTSGPEPRRVVVFRVTDNFFDVWGVKTILGRSFLPGEDRASAPPTALLSHGFWERSLGSDPKAVGTTLDLDGKPHLVVGVVSPKMEFGDLSSVDLWVPMGRELLTAKRDERLAFTQARLEPGVSASEAQKECELLASRLHQLHPESRGWSFRVSPVADEVLNQDDRSIVLVLFISVGFVLFIACANVANMLMARTAARSREIAVRLALGARRGGIVRGFLTEAMLLSLGGALVGLLLSRGLLDLLVLITSGQQWIYRAASIDHRALLFTLAIAAITPLFFAFLPSLSASRPDLTASLKEGARAGTGRLALRSRGFLVAAQIAMALSIMVVTGLLARHVWQMKNAGLGFEPEGVLTVAPELPEAKYPTAIEAKLFYDELVEGARSTPGVVDAAVVSPVPLAATGQRLNFRIEGRSAASTEAEESPSAYFFTSGPRYLSLMKIPLLRGRDFAPTDDDPSVRVALLNETGASRYFSQGDAVGSRIQLGRDPDGSWIEIVGVVGDVVHLDEKVPSVPQIYLAFAQSPAVSMSVVARAGGEESALAERLRALVLSLEPDATVQTRTLPELRREVFASADAVIALFAVFAGFALAMASMGIYGVMSYAVSQRERELGIRMALGADRGDVTRMVAAQGSKLVALGALAGLAGAALLSRMLSGVLFEMDLFDPATLATVTGVLVFVAFVSNWLPARRATRVDPIATLRAE